MIYLHKQNVLKPEIIPHCVPDISPENSLSATPENPHEVIKGLLLHRLDHPAEIWPDREEEDKSPEY